MIKSGGNKMSINYAILGILSYKDLTGYDMKKIIQDSSFMYWSANNNQIYKSLVQLLDEGLVTSEVHHQDSSPSKKIYTITDDGVEALKEWVMSSPELPEIKNTFLIQLAWADQLNGEELNKLLSNYENEIRMQILLQQEKRQRGVFSPGRTSREIFLWDMIHDNIISSNKNELNWIQNIRKELCSDLEKEGDKMNLKVVEKDNKKYIESNEVKFPISSEQDALDIVAFCIENDTYRVMLSDEVLSEDFFKLKTGLAGKVLQKFVNYNIKAVLIMKSEEKIKGKFKELASETSKSNNFRIFKDMDEAVNWLLM